VWRTTATAAHAAGNMGVRNGSVAAGRAKIGPGQYAARIWAKSSVASRQVALRVRFYDAAGSILVAHTGSTVTLSATPNTYSAVTHTATAPANTVSAELEVIGAGASAWVIGQTLDGTWAQIETGMSSLPDFWDGDDPTAGGFRYLWEGAELLSPSLKFDTSNEGGFWLAAPDATAKDTDGNIVPNGSGTMLHTFWDFGFGQWKPGGAQNLQEHAMGYQNILSGRESLVIV